MTEEYYLEVWLTAKPFTNTAMRMAGMNSHQKNMFLSICKMFLEGFNEPYERKNLLENYRTEKQISIKFWGDKEYLQRQKIKIEEEAFKAIMEDKYKSLRNKIKRIMPKKQRPSDAEMAKFSNYEKFVSGISLFNITLIMDIYEKSEL